MAHLVDEGDEESEMAAYLATRLNIDDRPRWAIAGSTARSG
jgi:hypothetical protein